MLLLALAPVTGADHAEDALADVDRTLERLDARVDAVDEARARTTDADRARKLDADRAALAEDAARFRQARAFLAGLDADVAHVADVDVARALEGLVDDARDAARDIERLEERRARLEERRDALDADDAERRARLDARIASVDEDIAERAAERDAVLARFDAFTALDVRDDPARLAFAVSALDALEDVDRRIERALDRVDRLEERRADVQARLDALDDEDGDARADTLRRLSLETRLARADAELVEHRAGLAALESARDALATLDADAVDDALLERASVRVDLAFADVDARVFDEDEDDVDARVFDEDEDDVDDEDDERTRSAASVSGGASATRESDLELDDVVNALALL